MRARVLISCAANLVLAACGTADPEAAPVELRRGLWRTESSFGTPKVDGLSIDALARDLPAPSSDTRCMTPAVRQGKGVIDLLNVKRNACSLTAASSANGRIVGEGLCPGIARLVSAEGDEGESWLKVDGSYDPEHIAIDSAIVVTAKNARGVTERMTIDATMRADRTGDCS